MLSWKNYLEENAKVIFGSFVDDADGKTYKTVTIGNQTWMAENYTREVENSYSVLDPNVGRLYSPKAIGSLAPKGWHIPTQEEWNELIDLIKSEQGFEIANSLNPPFLKNYVDEKDSDFKPDELFTVRCVKDVQFARNDSDEIVQNHTELIQENANLKKELSDAQEEGKRYKKRGDDLSNRLMEKETEYKRNIAELYENQKSESAKCSAQINEKDNQIAYLDNELKYYRELCETYKKQIIALAAKLNENVVLEETEKRKVVKQESSNLEDFTDPRDNEKYRTVTINGKTWFAQNLRYKGDFKESESCSPENNPIYDKSFGRFYTWDAAKRACPAGWRLPTPQEWDELARYMEGKYGSNYRKQLIAPIPWNGGQQLEGFDGDLENFSVLPAGFAVSSNNTLNAKDCDKQVGFSTRFWTGSKSNARSLDRNDESLHSVTTSPDWGFSVRCVKKEIDTDV